MQTVLTRAELEAYDLEGGRGGRWLCPLPACVDHTDKRKHRSLALEASGVWNCHRCKAGGQLKDHWKPFTPRSRWEIQAETRKRRDAEETRKLEEIGARFKARARPRSVAKVGTLGQAALVALGASGQAPAAVIAPPGAVQTSNENRSPRMVPPELKEVLYRTGTLQSLDDTRALSFLSLRGFGDGSNLHTEYSELLTRARVKFAPDFGRREVTEEKKAYQGTAALVFPIFDDAGQLVAFQGRKTESGSDLKVLTFGPKTNGLFWGPGAREAYQKGDALAITEAPLDALSLAVCGVAAVALCGSSHLPEFLTCGAFGRRYWLAFDADGPGDEAAQVIAAELRTWGAIVSRLRPSESKDWNDALQAGGVVWARTAAALLSIMGTENHTKTTLKNSLFVEPLYTVPGDRRQEVVSWALSEACLGTLPEPAATITLPSGQQIAADNAAVWLQEAQQCAEAHSLVSHVSVDAERAFLLVRQDMRALALWAADARVWLDSPESHQGAFCLLP